MFHGKADHLYVCNRQQTTTHFVHFHVTMAAVKGLLPLLKIKGDQPYLSSMENQSSVNLNPSIGSREAGIVGLSITGLIWIITSWRLVYHYSGWWSKCCHRPREEGEISRLRTDGLTTKRMVHVLLWTATVVEVVAYGDMLASSLSDKLNYTLLDIVGRGILEFSTFVIVTIYWFNLTSKARAGASEKRFAFTLFPLILGTAAVAVTVTSTFEAVVLLHGDYPTVHDFRSTSKIHKISLIVESVAWGIHAIIVSICGGMVYTRISSLPTFAQVRSRAKRNIITKMIIPIIFCALSYAIRSGWYAADFVSRLTAPGNTFETGVGWYVGNVWIPTLVPSMCLLYSIRKRDRDPGSIDGVSDVLLQPRTAEDVDDPFQSFNRTFRDLDDDSKDESASLFMDK